MESPMTKIKSQLECPVCFNIPRDLPIPSCPSGHIVCRPCKKRVTHCPTCRQPMPANMTNSVVGGLIEQVQHRCKFNDQGCEVKMLLKDLVIHEKQCPERTIKCPRDDCARLVKLKDFDTHALEDEPVHSLTRNSSTLGYTIVMNDVINQTKWKMGCIRALDQFFHVNFVYHKPRKCFVISVWLAKVQSVASNYMVNILIKGDNRNLCFDGIKVCSVENVPSIDKCIEENGNLFLCLPISLAKNILVKEDYGVVDMKEELLVKFSFKKI